MQLHETNMIELNLRIRWYIFYNLGPWVMSRTCWDVFGCLFWWLGPASSSCFYLFPYLCLIYSYELNIQHSFVSHNKSRLLVASRMSFIYRTKIINLLLLQPRAGLGQVPSPRVVHEVIIKNFNCAHNFPRFLHVRMSQTSQHISKYFSRNL